MIVNRNSNEEDQVDEGNGEEDGEGDGERDEEEDGQELFAIVKEEVVEIDGVGGEEGDEEWNEEGVAETEEEQFINHVSCRTRSNTNVY